MLSAVVGVSVNKTFIFIIAAHIWEQDRGMAVPVRRICIPEYLTVICFVIDFSQLSAKIIDLYPKSDRFPVYESMNISSN